MAFSLLLLYHDNKSIFLGPPIVRTYLFFCSLISTAIFIQISSLQHFYFFLFIFMYLPFQPHQSFACCLSIPGINCPYMLFWFLLFWKRNCLVSLDKDHQKLMQFDPSLCCPPFLIFNLIFTSSMMYLWINNSIFLFINHGLFLHFQT